MSILIKYLPLGLTILLFGVLSHVIHAQTAQSPYEVEQFTIKQGLSNRDLKQCSMDPEGFIWVSSRGGLSRFDGVQFQNHALKEFNFKDESYVCFKIDVNGKFWVYPKSRFQFLVVFNPKTGQIENFEKYFENNCPFKINEIFHIADDLTSEHGCLIVLKSNRLFRYDGKFQEIKVPDGFNICDYSFLLSKFSDQLLWTNNNYLLETNGLNQVRSIVEGPHLIDKVFNGFNGVKYLTCGNHSDDIRTFRNAFYKKLPNQSPREVVLKQNGHEIKCDALFKAEVNPDGSGIGYSGQYIYCFDAQANVYQTIDLKTSMFGPNIPVINEILIQDNGNIIWASTSDGLVKIHFTKRKFHNFLQGKSIRGMVQWGDSLIINSYSGQYIYHFSNQQTEPSTLRFPYGLGMATTPEWTTLYWSLWASHYTSHVN